MRDRLMFASGMMAGVAEILAAYGLWFHNIPVIAIAAAAAAMSAFGYGALTGAWNGR